MPDKKITELIANAAPLDADLFVMVKDPTGSPVDVKVTLGDVKKAFDKLATFSDANYSVQSTDKLVLQIGTLTAPRTLSLPAANSVPAGHEIVIGDASGSVTLTNTITIQRAGTDTINGQTSTIIASPYGARSLSSDGVSKWTFESGVLRSSNNLSDLQSAVTARGNLGLMIPDVQLFLSSGTWTKPPNATVVRLIGIGGGAGGGSGRRGSTATVRCGGGGGQGAGMNDMIVPASVFNATEPVTIGAGGIGGAAVTTDNTDGNAGGLGGSTIFKAYSYFRAGNGIGGNGGTATGGNGGASGGGGFFNGGAGGNANGSGGNGGNGNGVNAAGNGGGAGGGISITNVDGNGGLGTFVVGSLGGSLSSYGRPNGGTAPGGAGQNGNNIGDITSNYLVYGGPAGAGGAASSVGPAGNGGNAGKFGSGGGGGGASLNGNNSGAGGNGSDGALLVISW